VRVEINNYDSIVLDTILKAGFCIQLHYMSPLN